MNRTVLLSEPSAPVARDYEYRAARFVTESKKAAMVLEVKAARAIWDRNLRGGEGGYRCAEGTENGGAWTDEFGRNCGGPARRIGNALGNALGAVPRIGEMVAPPRRGRDRDNSARRERARQDTARREQMLADAERLERQAQELLARRRPQGARPNRGEARRQRLLEQAERDERRARRLRGEETPAPEPAPEPTPRPVTPKPAKANLPQQSQWGNLQDQELESVERMARADLAELERNRVAQGGVLRKEQRQQQRVLQKYIDDVAKENAKRRREEALRRAQSLAEKERERLRLWREAQAQQAAREAAEREERRRVAAAAEAERQAQQAAREAAEAERKKREPIVDGVGRKKLSGLLPRDFTDGQRQEIDTFIASESRKFVLSQYRDATAGTLRGAAIEIDNRVNQLQADMAVLRRQIRGGEVPGEQVRALQQEWYSKKEAIDILQTRQRTINERAARMVLREGIERQLADYEANKDASPVTRANALAVLDNAINMHAQLTAGNVAFVDDGAPEFNERVRSKLNEARLTLQRQREIIDGPQDMDAALKFAEKNGWKRLLDEQKAVEANAARMLDVIKGADPDKVERVNEEAAAEVERLRKRIAKLGAREEGIEGPAGDDIRQRNAERAWLNGAVDAYAFALPVRDRAPMYGRARPKDPVLGNLHDGRNTVAISNPAIKSASDAIAHVKNGGSLSEVPNEFWGAAIVGNSSNADRDANTIFRELAPNGGAIGLTRIFVRRGPDGTMTSQGYVLKAADNSETLAEILSQNVMVRHGLPVEGGGWDGTVKDAGMRATRGHSTSEVFAVLPFASNAFETDRGKLGSGGRNYGKDVLNRAEDIAAVQRFHGLVHNYLFQVSDRHGNNGFAGLDGDKPVVVPIDQGWAGRSGTRRFLDYASQDYLMDMSLPNTVAGHLRNVAQRNRTAALAQARKFRDAFDDMVRRSGEVADMGEEGWIEMVKPGARFDADRYVRKLHGQYARGAANLRNERDLILQSFIPADILAEL